MKIRIEDRQCFEEMLKNGEIKTEWSQFERYGVETIVNAAFENYIKECEDFLLLISSIKAF